MWRKGKQTMRTMFLVSCNFSLLNQPQMSPCLKWSLPSVSTSQENKSKLMSVACISFRDLQLGLDLLYFILLPRLLCLSDTPSESTQSTTETKSVAKLGMSHLRRTSFPKITWTMLTSTLYEDIATEKEQLLYHQVIEISIISGASSLLLHILCHVIWK